MTLLAIDGPAGAGKTTFAAKLEAELSLKGTVKVIHMDDVAKLGSEDLVVFIDADVGGVRRDR